jgi:hypothetical protein
VIRLRLKTPTSVCISHTEARIVNAESTASAGRKKRLAGRTIRNRLSHPNHDKASPRDDRTDEVFGTEFKASLGIVGFLRIHPWQRVGSVFF